jgi:hypothetical protein
MRQKNTVGGVAPMERFAMVTCVASNGGYANIVVARLAFQEWRHAEGSSASGSSDGFGKGTVSVNWLG